MARQIADWYSLPLSDIERIEFEDSLDHDCFVIRPSKVKFFGRRARKSVYPDSNPLTLTSGHQSSFIAGQVDSLRRRSQRDAVWVASQIGAIVQQHAQQEGNVDERDLLRASGALHKLGIDLGMYRTRDVDCPDAEFRFDSLPGYPCPVEIEERSSGFLAPHHSGHRKQRIVVLCMEHDEPTVMSGYVDVFELRALARLLSRSA